MNLCDLKVNLCGQKKLKGAELAAHTVNSPLNRLPSWHFYSNFQTCKRSSEISSNHCNVMYEGSPFDRPAFSFIFPSSSRPGIMGSPSQVPQLTCVYTRGSGNLTRYHGITSNSFPAQEHKRDISFQEIFLWSKWVKNLDSILILMYWGKINWL